VRWGLPATERWYFEATAFEDTPTIPPAQMPKPQTLETYIQQRAAVKAA